VRAKIFNPPKDLFQDSEFWVMNNEDHKPGEDYGASLPTEN
jgi:hypothetical protein